MSKKKVKLIDGSKTRLVLLGIVLVIFTCFSRLNAAHFQGLGLLLNSDDSRYWSYAEAVSADGSVVVGDSGKSVPYHLEAFRWATESGMVGLGFLPENSYWSNARGVSADGSVVIGTVEHDFPPYACHDAFRWTESGGMVSLGWLSTYHQSQAEAVSADGSVVVGHSMNTSGFTEAFRWTESGGMLGLGELPGGDNGSYALGVSDNGLAVVGYSLSASGIDAFRWTEPEGMVNLGGYRAYDVSDDGSIIVGSDGRWTESGGWQDIGGTGKSLTPDGSIVVGSGGGAFIWDESHGTRSIQDMLENDFDLALTGWTLNSATGISADGLTIVGTGTNPIGQTEAWIASIVDLGYPIEGPKPGYLTGDFTGNGNTNLEDFAKLALYWLEDESSVDIRPLPNGDSVVDFQDLSVLTEHWLEDFYGDFETGDFSKYDWQVSAPGHWYVVYDYAHEGTYSAWAGYIPDGQSSILGITLSVSTGRCPAN
jgi:probable HAF family extracellular repeat protein